MREGLRSSSLRKGGKVNMVRDWGDLDVVKVPDLNVKEDLDMVSGEDVKCCHEMSENSGQVKSRCMEIELEGERIELESVKFSVGDACESKEVEVGLTNQMSNDDEDKINDFSAVWSGAADVGGERKEVEGLNCTIGATDELMLPNSQALENVDNDMSIVEVKENELNYNDEVELCGDDCNHEKEGEIMKIEDVEGEVRVVGKVSRSRIVPAGSGQSKLSELKRKRGINGPLEEAITVKEESEKMRKCGRPKKSIDLSEDKAIQIIKILPGPRKKKGKRGRPKNYADHPEEEVLQLNCVPFISEDEDEELSNKTVQSPKQKGKRGRPKKYVDHLEEEVLQLNRVPFISEDEDEELGNKTVGSPKQKGKRGRPKKFIDSPVRKIVQRNRFQALSEVEDEDLNHKLVGRSKKKQKRGRPKKSLDCSDGKFDCVVSDEATVGNSEPKRKRGRPKKSDACPGEEVIQMKKASFHERPSHKSVKNPKKKQKQGRPRKSLDCSDGELDCAVSDGAIVGNSEPKRRRGRPKKSDACPGEEVIQMKKASFHERLSHKSVKNLKKKQEQGRPRKSLDCSDGELDCISDGAIVGNSEPKCKRGRPIKSDACPGEEVIQMRKVSFHEQLSDESVKNPKTKRKRGRPKKEDGNDALKATFHGKDKVKNGGKMHKSPTDGIKGHLSDGRISTDVPGTELVLASSKGQRKPLAKNNIPKKKKNFDKLGTLSGEKNLIRNQIVDMLMAAGWTVEYRPRQGREYNDAVYVNHKGRTHWSVTKAYLTLKREFEEGKSNFCFTPLPEETLSKLFRVVSKTRSDKNTKKQSGMKRKHSGLQNKRRCALVVRRSKNSEIDEIVAHTGKHSILAWMIDSGIILLNGKVHYMNQCKTEAILEGSITRDGILCNCCKEVISAFEYEKHAGSKLCEPYENIYLENGSSLLQCQVESWSKQEETSRSRFHNVRVDGEDPNDDTCGVCGDGGDLMCCDGCPSTFHNDCLDVEEVPSGEWHCVYCSCKFCGRASDAASESDDDDCEPLSSLLVSCSLCEKKYHESCIDDEDVCTGSRQPTFCGKNCEQIHTRLQSLVGAKRDLGDGYSYTVLQQSDVKEDASTLQPQKILINSKLAIALSIMDECFLPIIDHRSGINLIRHIVYSCGSNFKRLNFRHYFTVVLERGDEAICTASIRIRGKQVAEMPFIGTRNFFRRQGMCRRLLNAIELVLVSLDVENLVIPAISELLQTWTSVFGFKPLEESLKKKIRSMSLLVFPHTDMLQKPLSKQQQFVLKRIPITGEDLKSRDADSIDCGADKSEVDNNGCLTGKFDLNSEAPNISQSPPDESHRVEGERKPDLNLMAESICEDDNTTDSNPIRKSQKEKTLNFDLNLIEENVTQINKLPSDI